MARQEFRMGSFARAGRVKNQSILFCEKFLQVAGSIGQFAAPLSRKGNFRCSI
jgi:hypothetical protein